MLDISSVYLEKWSGQPRILKTYDQGDFKRTFKKFVGKYIKNYI